MAWAKKSRIRVVTYYAPAPHAGHKLYVFDVLEDDKVIYRSGERREGLCLTFSFSFGRRRG